MSKAAHANTTNTIRELEAQALTAALMARIFGRRYGDAAAPATIDPSTKRPAPAAAVARELVEA